MAPGLLISMITTRSAEHAILQHGHKQRSFGARCEFEVDVAAEQHHTTHFVPINAKHQSLTFCPIQTFVMAYDLQQVTVQS